MPSVTRLGRIVRLVTLPETRRAIVAAARSDALHEVARRAANDRAGLVRDLRSRAKARALLRSAIRHPAARELAAAGLLFLPARYMPVGWAASWAARRVLRRLGPPTKRVDASPVTADQPPTDVTPETR
jgi:hypothetical protein